MLGTLEKNMLVETFSPTIELPHRELPSGICLHTVVLNWTELKKH